MDAIEGILSKGKVPNASPSFVPPWSFLHIAMAWRQSVRLALQLCALWQDDGFRAVLQINCFIMTPLWLSELCRKKLDWWLVPTDICSANDQAQGQVGPPRHMDTETAQRLSMQLKAQHSSALDFQEQARKWAHSSMLL
eukprot:1148682-Pelagomonas_calceolata.AAC.12